MERLPAEIIDKVASYLYEHSSLHPREIEEVHRCSPWSQFEENLLDWGGQNLAPYTVISRQWQAAVEKLIWEKVVLLDEEGLQSLEQYTSGNLYRCMRRMHIRHMIVDASIGIPRTNPPSSQVPKSIANDFPTVHNHKYRNLIVRLFGLLHSWTSGPYVTPGIDLWLGGGGPYTKEGVLKVIDGQVLKSLSVDELYEQNQMSHLFHLTSEDVSDIPNVSCVKSFNVREIANTPVAFRRKFSHVRPSAYFQTLSCLSGVKRAWGRETYVIPPDAIRALQEHRQELADHLPLVPSSVETFKYTLYHRREMSYEYWGDAANYLSPSGRDELSIAFGTLGTRLRTLTLDGVRISPQFFYSPSRSNGESMKVMHWPHLEVLQILDMPPYTADGKWIIDEDAEKENNARYRRSLCGPRDMWTAHEYGKRGLMKNHQLDKLYQAMGRAARQMPRLRLLSFTFRGEMCKDFSDVNFDTSESLHLSRDRESSAGTRLEINTVWKYQLGNDVISAWGLEREPIEKTAHGWVIMSHKWPLLNG
ncbi:hypothetical protein P170DRAFT_506899 [Aspergillus steynii IBT 23096]|uniref:F-box domain-containing protein n=1 Tax=Aspergillus steynii IBT 23096 TaxID=1392250 RepID=A0A2I2GGI2_9EURO|nr:uncharacterized protein P170DRAFT_506899 [Aspergillus steynii IBT 23096]PLB51992.1 hypothetical protein P170DRAFT_506899 [Aspergillus steynii IBT 23096]